MKKQLLTVGIVFLFITVFLIAASIMNDNAKADGAQGTWEGTCTDQTDAADFHYHAILRLTGGSSVNGTLELSCTSVNVKISGYEDAQNMVGTTTTVQAYGTLSGSSLTLYVSTSGGTFTFYFTVSGGKMTGGSQYAGATTEINTWTFDLTSDGITNHLPVANANGPYSGYVNTSITFNGSGSLDSDGIITNYTWFFGDGRVGYGISPTHTYTQAANYTVTLRVTDNNGSLDEHTTFASVTVGQKEKPKTPGFELVFVVCAIALILFWKRKLKL